MTQSSSARVPVLLLYAKGNVSWQQCIADTLVEGLRLDFTKLPSSVHSRLPKRLQSAPYASLSYVGDWVDAFQGSSRLRTQLCNVCDLTALSYWLTRLHEFPLVFVMHSANGDGLGHLAWLAPALRRRSGLLVVFVSNEYNHLAQKRAFIRDSAADYAATQLPPTAAAWLYAECGRARPLSAFAALNTRAFPAPIADSAKTIDLLFRGSKYALALGDEERTRAIAAVRDEGKRRGLRVDIAFSLINGARWSEMLRNASGIPGAESGTYFLERDSASYHRAESYERSHTDAQLRQIKALFYSQGTWPVSGKMLSSRHLEPMGTKTCQLLVEGEYNGILKPNQHYIPLAKDLSNVAEALEKFADVAFRNRLIETSYDLAMSELTFERRVEQILTDLGV